MMEYKILKKGEMLKEGDEYGFADDWRKTMIAGRRLTDSDVATFTYRRIKTKNHPFTNIFK